MTDLRFSRPSGRGERFSSAVCTSVEHYFDAIGREALERAGGPNPQLKGHIFEMLWRDKCNLDLGNRLKGITAVLTRSPQAHAVDVVQMQDGKCVGRWQCKDVTSASGMSKIRAEVRKGHYRSAKLVGTTETAQKYNAGLKPGDKKTMLDSGISSSRTGRIADNMGVDSPAKDVLKGNLADVAACAKNAAGIGAVFGAAGSVMRNAGRWSRDEIDTEKFVGAVLMDSVKGACESGVKTGTALCIKEGVKYGAKQTGSAILKSAAKSNALTAVCFGAAEVAYDGVQLARGKMDGGEFMARSTGTVAAAAGGYGGAVWGAALGAILLPGIGGPIGGFLGAAIGSMGASAAGRAVGDAVFR